MGQLRSLLALTALLRPASSQTYTIAVAPRCDARNNEFFDASSLSCSACDDDSDGTGHNANKVPDTSALDRYGNALSCRCADGYAAAAEECSSSALLAGTCAGFTCSSCLADGNATYLDASSCAPCGNTTNGVSSSYGDCACPADSDGFTQVLMELTDGGDYLPAKECSSCAAGTRVFLEAGEAAGVRYAADAYACRSCPDSHASFDSAGACSCDSGYTQTGVAQVGALGCVATDRAVAVSDWNTAAASVVSYSAVQTTPTGFATGTASVDSLVFQHYFLAAAAGCHEYVGGSGGGAANGDGSSSGSGSGTFGTGDDASMACQTLANLCVLQLYGESTKACALFQVTTASRAATNYAASNWAITLPWLYYDAGPAPRTATGVGAEMTLGSTLRFRLAKFSLDGRWLGMVELNTLPFYCGAPAPDTGDGGGTSRSTDYLSFGHAARESFKCDLATLVGSETFFYDMYVVDSATETLYPVAVLVTNFPGDANVNVKAADETDDRFTRRFFFFDAVGGVSDDSAAVASSSLFSSYASFSSQSPSIYSPASLSSASAAATAAAAATSAAAEGGTAVASAATNFVPDVLRYASAMTLRVTARTDVKGLIYAPTLEITYTEVKPSSWAEYSELQKPSISWKVDYTMDTSSFWSICRAFFAVVVVVCAVVVLWRLRNRHVRGSRADAPPPPLMPQQLPSVDWKALFQTVACTAHTFVLLLFPFTFFVCAYWFVMFKLQDTVYVLLPPEEPGYNTDDYYPLKAIINLLFFFQLLRILQLIVVQCRADVFFLDWERPANGGKAGASAADSGGGAIGGKAAGGGASVWRQLFVANEWNELQAARRTDRRFTLMWLTFLLLGLDLQYTATSQPDLADLDAGRLNPALRFASTTFWWLMLGLGQWLWRWAVAERYLGEPPEQRFIDMATMAKISTVILDERYHGYYLHCRSPYPRAEVSMAEMVAQLSKEEAGLTTDRGLHACPPDLQTFELFVTDTWRRKYDRLYAAVLQPYDGGAARWRSTWGGPVAGGHGGNGSGNGGNGRSGAGGGGGGSGAYGGASSPWRRRWPAPAASGGLWGMGGFGAGSGSGGGISCLMCQCGQQTAPTERMVAAARDLSMFVQGFVEQGYAREELRLSYREPAWWDRLLGAPPDMRQLQRSPCILYPDRRSDFARLTFLGQEVDLQLLDILTYSVCDLWFGDTATSILLTYLVGSLVVAVRRRLGEANIARKTLVDERFLL